MTNRSAIGSLVVLCVLATAAVADQAPETVVVTASPPDPVGNDAFSVVRVTPAQLRSSHQIDDALKDIPGLSLFRRDSSLNANPTTQGVSVRSIAPSGAGRALVTLDGVPQNDPFGNWVIWSSLPAEDMGGAQIVRGAGAGPYGAGALTGVIALNEATGDGFVAGDLSGGARGQRRVAASGGTDIDRFEVFASASAEASNGWIPVGPEQRGAADDYVTLDAKSASIRVQTYVLADTLISARYGAYQETRNSGIMGSTSAADGQTASVTVAHPDSAGELGWRMQLWMRDVGFSNVTYAAGANRATAAPANNQYATPATGIGGNAALRGQMPWFDWEIGADVRSSEGESREQFSFVSGAFTSGRHAGGDSFVGGVYVEAAHREDGWLITAGARADYWQTSNGHVTQTSLATGATTLDDRFPSKGGTLPTGRLGVRRDFDGGFYLRSAAYEGFRAPSLNELYRPFRLGTTNTLGNPDLTPEQLYGAELGGGWQDDRVTLDGDAFLNQLHRAVTNVTLASCPTNFPCTQLAGVTIVQRQNVGDIDAWGLEGGGHYRILDGLVANAAFDYVDAHVEGGVQAPQLTGNRPAQAPRWTITGGFESRPLPRLSIDANLRYEGLRYADDLNKFRLGAAVTLDARIAYAITQQLSAYLYGDNLFDARVASTASFGPTSTGTGAVVSYSEPLIFGGGVSWTQ